MEKRMPKVGDHVIFDDSKGRPNNALVAAVWSEECINLVIVSPDERKQDDMGRQIERHHTSIPHKAEYLAHGNYFRWPDEEPNPIKAPVDK